MNPTNAAIVNAIERMLIACSFSALSFVNAAIGAEGLDRRICKHIKGDKSSNGLNNKIQSTAATITLIAGSILSALYSPHIGAFFFLTLAIGVNTPHIAKLFVKDPKTKERLDNIAGIAGSIINITLPVVMPIGIMWV